MEKTPGNMGKWLFGTALVLGLCLVIATVVNVLPSILAVRRVESYTSAPPILQTTSAMAPPQTVATLATIREAFAEDKFEGKSPDFRKLIVSYTDKVVYVTIVFNSGVDKLMGSDFVYMYGTHHDMIRLSSGSFRLERDGGADGHFEEVVYSGSTRKIATDTINIEIPLEYLPDISEKAVWAYSMQSQDRIPDEGELLLPDASPLK